MLRDVYVCISVYFCVRVYVCVCVCACMCVKVNRCVPIPAGAGVFSPFSFVSVSLAVVCCIILCLCLPLFGRCLFDTQASLHLHSSHWITEFYHPVTVCVGVVFVP